jgi:hypothetical protein
LILVFLGSLAGHTPDEDKMQNFKKAQKRTKFVFGVLGSLDGHTPEQEKIQNVKKLKIVQSSFWGFLVRSPATPRMKIKCKTSKRLKIVQSSILGFLVRSTATPRSKKKYKTSRRLKIVQSLFLGFLGSLAGHTPDEDKMQNVKKAQNRTKFVFGVSRFARRPPRMKSKCKTSKSLKIVQSLILGFLGSLAGHPG